MWNLQKQAFILVPCLFSGAQITPAAGMNHVEELTITATRGRTPVFAAPYTVSVLKERALRQRQVRNLPEALSETPGVLVQKTANGQGSPYLRGFTGYRTLALIDGIRYNNSVYRDGPSEYFSLIDAYTLESIELLSGPASTLYGSDAIGGVLNLKTKSSGHEDEKPGRMFLHGAQSLRLALGESSQISRSELTTGRGGAWGLRLGYSWKGFGDVRAADLGRLPKTGYSEYAYDARLDIRLNPDWQMTLARQSLTQDDVWRTHSTLFAKSFAGSAIGKDRRRLKDQQRTLNYLKLSGSRLGDRIRAATLTLSYQSSDEDGDRIRRDGRRNIEFFDSRMYGLDLQLESDTAIGGWVYGLDYYQDKVDTGRSDFNADGSLRRVRIQGPVGDDASFSILGAYLQGRFDLGDRLTVTAGSRLSHIRAAIGRFQDPATGRPASFRDDWSSHVSAARASYSLDAEDACRLWAGLSQSFRAPNIADLSRFGKSRSNETEVAATDLSPEKFLTWEAGLKLERAGFNFTGTYYFTDISDYITSTPTGRVIANEIEVSKQNSASGFVQGIELTADYRFGNGLTPYGHITWLEGKLDVFNTTASKTAVTEYLSRVMPLTVVAGLKWQNADDSLWANLALTHATRADKLSAGDRGDTQRIPPGGTPAYTLLNLRGGLRINDHLAVNLALNNLLDEAYRAHGSGGNEPGLNLIVGLNARF